MAIVDKAWDGSASRYANTPAFCRACIVNTNTGDPKTWTQDNCKLPVEEPNGDVNRNAVHNAAARLSQTQIPPAQKKAAARKLAGYYRQMKEDLPDIVKRLAGA